MELGHQGGLWPGIASSARDHKQWFTAANLENTKAQLWLAHFYEMDPVFETVVGKQTLLGFECDHAKRVFEINSSNLWIFVHLISPCCFQVFFQ
jgi:hypothetical protein